MFFNYFGPKPGKSFAIRLIVGVKDLPDFSLVRLRQRTVRVKMADREPSSSDLSKKFVTVTAARWFQETEAERGLMVTITPCNTVEQARHEVAKDTAATFLKPRFKSKLLDVCEVQAIEISSAEALVAYEFSVARRSMTVHGKVLSGSIDKVCFTVQSSATKAEWTWDKVAAIGEAQASKIRRGLESVAA